MVRRIIVPLSSIARHSSMEMGADFPGRWPEHGRGLTVHA